MGGENLIELAGRRFGRLVVLARERRKKARQAYWRCRCDCGNEVVVSSYRLRMGQVTSCGCEQRLAVDAALSERMGSESRLHALWSSMMRRCEDPSDPRYKKYGGAGVRVCDEWREFGVFGGWAVRHGYSARKVLKRKDAAKGYSPDNCMWIYVQKLMRSPGPRHGSGITIDGVTYDVAGWSDISGVNYDTIHSRLARGWSGKEAVFAPARKMRGRGENKAKE